MSKSMAVTRRQFIQASLAGSLVFWLAPAENFFQKRNIILNEHPGKIEKQIHFSLGLASYTFRAFSLEKTIAMALRLGLKKICLKDVHLPLNLPASEIRATASKVRAAGLDLYGCGVIYMNNEAEVEQAFNYAQNCGVRIIVASPRPDLLPHVEEKVKQTGLCVAIHNHGPGDKYYPTPAEAYQKIHNLDRRIGLCLDIGHATRAGVNPAEAAAKFANRLLDIHLKDVSAANQEGQTVEIGRGVIDILEFLRTLIKINYSGTLAFEYEKDEQDPLPGLAESVGYIRALLKNRDTL